MIQDLKRRGLNIFPLRKKGAKDAKFPSRPWAQYQNEIYNDTFPVDNNIAIVCGKISGNLVVVDLDDKTLYDLFSEYHDKTFIVKTGKQGHHIYFKTAEPVPSTKMDDKDGRHIDIQSEGKYVVAPGSVHPNGNTYDVICDKDIMEIDPIKLRDKLYTLGFTKIKTSIDEISQGIKKGNRNDGIFKYATYMIKNEGITGIALKTMLVDLNAKCNPPLPESELNVIQNSAEKHCASNIIQSIEVRKLGELQTKILEILKKDDKMINLSEITPFYKWFDEDKIKDMFRAQSNNKVEFENERYMEMYDITPAVEGIPIRFKGTIYAMGERQTFARQADFDCTHCGKHINIFCDETYNIPIPKCDKCRISMKLNRKTYVTEYIQKIRIQELLENSKCNTPVEFNAEIFGDMIGTVNFGDRRLFTGRFRSIPTKKYNDIVFEIKDMLPIEQTIGCLPEPGEVEKWKDNSNIYNIVRDSIAPEMYLDNNLKESCMLSLGGSNSINGTRERCHIAMIGDAQLGKTELMKAMHKIMVGSAYVIGLSASAAGLSVGIVKQSDGTSMPRAGVLPLHNGRRVFIDEIDKMREEDRNSLLTCMENGTVSNSKSSIVNKTTTFPANCTLIAGGNCKNTKFNPNLPNIMDNFNIEIPLITRFDILWLIVDKNDENDDQLKAEHVINYESQKQKYMSIEELQRYFNYVNTLHVTFNDDIKNKVQLLWRELRKENIGSELQIGMRLFFGIFRLISAHATLNLRETINDNDIDAVKRILKASINSLKIDGKISLNSVRRNKDTVFLETWKRCQDENSSIDQDDFVHRLAQINPFNGLSADAYFRSYKENGKITLNNKTKRYTLV